MNMLAKVGTAAAGVVAAMGVAAGVVVGVPTVSFLTEYGCGATEERLGEAMAADPVLDAGPDGVGPGKPFRECDDDDRFVTVGRFYTYDQGQEEGQDSDGEVGEDVLAHYRDAAPAHGWTHRSGGDCYSKRIDGATAYLTLDESADGVVEAGIISSREDSEPWC